MIVAIKPLPGLTAVGKLGLEPIAKEIIYLVIPKLVHLL
jgi:hypothetical protein